MKTSSSNKNIIQYRSKSSTDKNAIKSTEGSATKYDYNPTNEDEVDLRRRIWERYNEMKDDDLRREAQKQWDLGDKMYRLWTPERDARDWRADIALPDGFSAVQSHMQETINLRPRPVIKPTDSSDAPLERFASSVFNYAMDTTEFDQETYKARNASAIRGTAFTIEEYRYETRDVQMPTSFEDGELKYEKKTITDWDDVYTRFVENEQVFFDPNAEDAKYGIDCARVEVIPYDVFKTLYENNGNMMNVDKVVPASDVPKEVGFFKVAEGVGDQDVELIHYWNKLTDEYGILANSIVIRNTPLPSMHKELPVDVWTFYPIPGQIYGMGIPYIIHTLVEERRSIRNMSLDRQKMHIAKMFIVNDLFDVSEEDLTPRPHGLIRMNTNGLPLNQSIMPLEYGDVPGSSLRMDESLKEDERRAHGMDDRPALQQGGTATEAAIVKESAQQRINLINTLSNWNTLVGLGKKKWSNIQFYYKGQRMQRIFEDGKFVDKKEYRTIKVDGYEYKLVGDPEKGETVQLSTEKVQGWSSFKMNPSYAQFMDRNYDIIMDAEAVPVVSKAIKRAQVNEMFGQIAGNPLFSRFLNLESSLRRMVILNDESPADWLMGDGMSREQQRQQAQMENEIFLDMDANGRIFVLPGTPNATEAHNEVHLDFTNSQAFEKMSDAVKQAMTNHIQEEIQNNPALSQAAGLMAGGINPNGEQGGGNAVPAGMPGGPNVEQGGAEAAGMEAPVAGGEVTAGAPVA